MSKKGKIIKLSNYLQESCSGCWWVSMLIIRLIYDFNNLWLIVFHRIVYQKYIYKHKSVYSTLSVKKLFSPYFFKTLIFILAIQVYYDHW